MADLIATLFRFRLFLFEFGPFFLAAWFGLAVTTGLVTVVYRKKIDLLESGVATLKKPLSWPGRFLLLMLWHPDGKISAVPLAKALFLFSLAASIPALVATSLIDTRVVLLRLLLAAFFALFFNRLLSSALFRQRKGQGERPGADSALRSESPVPEGSASGSRRTPYIVKAVWKSFTGQVNSALLTLLIGFTLASAVTVYVPVYTIRPWLGDGAWWAPYLAALLAIPFQFSGGAEVPLASALLVKGASLGTAMSVMLVAPVTTIHMFRHLGLTMKARTITLYLLSAWFTAGTLGLAVDGTGQLLAVWW